MSGTGEQEAIVATGIFLGKYQVLFCPSCEHSILYSDARVGARLKCSGFRGGHWARVVGLRDAFDRRLANFVSYDSSGYWESDGVFISLDDILAGLHPERRRAWTARKKAEKRRAQVAEAARLQRKRFRVVTPDVPPRAGA